mmetsp:Transcript_5267/g.9347  ORF Transcript_5267/g.9347 Transcript_5267/m.9347 type:complete len:764 (-) Transcript_5267:4164-6455(-)
MTPPPLTMRASSSFTAEQDDSEHNGHSFQILSLDPERAELLLRHRSPSSTFGSVNGDDSHTSIDLETSYSQYRQAIHRIRTDGAANVRHAVPVVNEEEEEEEEHDNDDNDKNDTHGTDERHPDHSSNKDNDEKDKGKTSRGWSLWKKQSMLVKNSLRKKATIPAIEQCRQYSAATLKKDIVAGITVAIAVVPLSMSYATLAGLPVQYGLYSSFLPACVYPILGTCRQLVVGPAALVSLLVNTGLSKIVTDEGLTDPSSDEYIARYTELAIQCTFLVAIMNICLGVLGFGFITQFLSKALMSGFTSGAAIILSMSQLKNLFGLRNVPSSDRVYEMIQNLVRAMDQWNWKAFTLGSACIVVLVSLKYLSQNPRLSQKYPNIKWVRALGPFFVSFVAIVLAYTLDLEDRGIPMVGEIPSGLPSVSVNQWLPVSSKLWVVAISMVIVGFVQSVAISKRFAYKHGYEIDSSQELLGLGIANLIGGVFQAYPTTGAIGQSAINDDIGGQTGASSVISGLVVMLVLLFLTPVFENMPMSVLAAIVIVFVMSMFDYNEAIYLFKVHKFDFSVWIVAFLGTLFLGVEFGLAIAVAVSVIIVVYESVYPHTAVLGRLPGTSLYRNIKQYPNLERYDQLLIVRIDAPLYFANAHTARDKVRKYKRVTEEELAKRNAGVVRYIILDLSPVSHIDTTALHVLEDMYITQKRLGVTICMCNPGIAVTDRLLRSGLVDLMGRNHFFPDVIDAVHFCLEEMDCAEESALAFNVGDPEEK